MKTSLGILLQKDPLSAYKITIFDKGHGKIPCITHIQHKLSAGLLLSYFLEKDNRTFFIKEINIIDAPFCIAHNNILFMHHILELCNFFIPFESVEHKVFSLLLTLYKSPYTLTHSYKKKLFLYKFFISLGIQTSMTSYNEKLYTTCTQQSIDSILQWPIDLNIEKNLDHLLHLYVTEHPRFENFKTVHFLDSIRVK